VQDIDLTPPKPGDLDLAGIHSDAAADSRDKAYSEVVQAMERQNRSDSAEDRTGGGRFEAQPTVKVNEWRLYTPCEGGLFGTRKR
jgi:hypothetical protein